MVFLVVAGNSGDILFNSSAIEREKYAVPGSPKSSNGIDP